MAFDLFGEFLQHVDFALTRHPLLESLHDLLGPLAALAARRALPATLMLIERRKSRNRAHNVGRSVHDDDGRGAETRLTVL